MTIKPESPVTGHADYPHVPGTLYDCRKCESQCFCSDGPECVYCALSDERKLCRHEWTAGMMIVDDNDLPAVAAVRPVTCYQCGAIATAGKDY